MYSHSKFFARLKACIVLVSLALIATLLTLTASPAEASRSKNIKITTYNICAEKCGNLENWKRRSARVVSSIARNHPDIVLIQEAGKVKPHFKILNKRMKKRGYIMVSGKQARYIFIRNKTMTVKNGKKHLAGGTLKLKGVRSSKLQYFPYQLVMKKHTKSKTLIVNSHLLVGKNDVTDDIRLREASKTYGKLRKYMKKYATVWGGDFNSLSEDANPLTPRCGDYSVRYRVDQFMQSRGFMDAIFKTDNIRPGAIGTVNHSPESFTYDCRGQQIDHLYSDRRLQVQSWETNQRLTTYEQQYSDHDSVTVVFSRRG